MSTTVEAVMVCGRILVAALGLVLLANSGCADLRVRVAILNDTYKYSPQWRSGEIRARGERIERRITATAQPTDDLTRERDELVADLKRRAASWRKAIRAYDE